MSNTFNPEPQNYTVRRNATLELRDYLVRTGKSVSHGLGDINKRAVRFTVNPLQNTAAAGLAMLHD